MVDIKVIAILCRNVGTICALGYARRKFDEALKAQSSVDPSKQKSTLAAQALKQIQALYFIEREIKQLSAEEKQSVRQARSVPILKELKLWLDTNIIVAPPRSMLGKAMSYLNKQWDKLTVYTTDGRLRIDNNLCENAVRPFVIPKGHKWAGNHGSFLTQWQGPMPVLTYTAWWRQQKLTLC